MYILESISTKTVIVIAHAIPIPNFQAFYAVVVDILRDSCSTSCLASSCGQIHLVENSEGVYSPQKRTQSQSSLQVMNSDVSNLR